MSSNSFVKHYHFVFLRNTYTKIKIRFKTRQKHTYKKDKIYYSYYITILKIVVVISLDCSINKRLYNGFKVTFIIFCHLILK